MSTLKSYFCLCKGIIFVYVKVSLLSMSHVAFLSNSSISLAASSTISLVYLQIVFVVHVMVSFHTAAVRGGGLGSSTIVKKFNEHYAPS